MSPSHRSPPEHQTDRWQDKINRSLKFNGNFLLPEDDIFTFHVEHLLLRHCIFTWKIQMQCSARLCCKSFMSPHIRTKCSSLCSVTVFHLVQIVWTAHDPAGSWLGFKPILADFNLWVFELTRKYYCSFLKASLGLVPGNIFKLFVSPAGVWDLQHTSS